jgi:hypothetical protein
VLLSVWFFLIVVEKEKNRREEKFTFYFFAFLVLVNAYVPNATMASIKAMRTAVTDENSFIVDVAVVLTGLNTGW